MNDNAFRAARAFVNREGRLLEQRQLATMFDGASPGGVVDALRGYQNPDGGFGHGLEPDKRCPASLPIDVEIALQTLAAAGTVDEPMVRRACDFLAGVADPDGAVALASPVIESYPRAEHMTDWTYKPGVFPTAGIAGILHRMHVDHPWLKAATAYCWASIEAGLPDDAHALGEVLVFLEHAPDRARADALVPAIAEHLPETAWYRPDPEDERYGVTPLHLAPTPESRWRELFDDELLERHLRRLRAEQQADGGWPLSWQPPSMASTLEWRGMETLRAMRTLTAYGP